MSAKAGGVTKAIKRYSKVVQKAADSATRFYDAAIDGGFSEPPPGYWTRRLIREIAWRSFRARIQRAADRMGRA